MDKHWNGTGNYNATGVPDASHYSYWFTGADHTTHVSTAQGLPGSGDKVHWDGGAAGLTASLTWDNVTVAAGSALVMHGYGEMLTMHANCTIEAGVSLTNDQGGGLHLAAAWLGDVNMSSDSPQLLSGWTAPDLANVSVTSTSNDVSIYGPTGTRRFGNMTFNAASAFVAVNLSNIGPITLTGALTAIRAGGSQLILPSGNWLTLSGPNAKAFGVKAAASTAAGGLLVI